jgi:hypothetical protein
VTNIHTLVTATVPFGKSVAILENWVKNINRTTEDSEVIRMLTRFFAGEKSIGALIMVFSGSGIVDVDGLLDSKGPNFCSDKWKASEPLHATT